MKPNLRKCKSGLLGLFLIITALLVASPAQAYRFVVLGDSPNLLLDSWEKRGVAVNNKCLEYINNQILNMDPKPAFVFFLGDLVTRGQYQNPYQAGAPIVDKIPEWKEIMKPLPQNNIKVYVAIGNRDLYGPKGWLAESPPQKDLEDSFRTYFSDPPYFDMPGNGPAEPYDYRKLAYSFEYSTTPMDKALFVVLDNFAFFQDNSGQWVNWDNGVDEEQLNWFSAQAEASDAPFKFVLSHGPAFSPEGWPPSTPKAGNSLWDLWQAVQAFHFTSYFAGHEHIFSRWRIDTSVDPRITHPIIQTLAGTAGAYPDDPSGINFTDPVQRQERIRSAHIWSGYNYVVVDVHPGQAVQSAYGVTKETGDFKSKLLDTCTLDHHGQPRPHQPD